MGYIDNLGNFIIELRDHHVLNDDIGFLKKRNLLERQRLDKEGILEAYIMIQEISETEMLKF